jgi:ribosomal-protein-alanine N-acetyltransferase
MADWKYKEEAPPNSPPDWSTMAYPPAPILQSARIQLRPFHINDAPQLAACLNDPAVLAMLSTRIPNPYSVADAEWFINHLHTPSPQTSTTFAIVPIAEGASNRGLVVGSIGLDPGPDVFVRTAEIGYWLARSEWRKGYVSEAAKMLVDWAFGREEGISGQALLRMQSNIFGGNEASEGVLRKVGFEKEGVMRDAVWKGGVVRDLLVFGLTRRDWEEQRKLETIEA